MGMEFYRPPSVCGYDARDFCRYAEWGSPDRLLGALQRVYEQTDFDRLACKNIRGEVLYGYIIQLIAGWADFHIHGQCERRLSMGRVDALVETRRWTYLFEFKRGKAGGLAAAARQIVKKGYWLAFDLDRLVPLAVEVTNEGPRGIVEWRHVSIDPEHPWSCENT